MLSDLCDMSPFSWLFETSTESPRGARLEMLQIGQNLHLPFQHSKFCPNLCQVPLEHIRAIFKPRGFDACLRSWRLRLNRWDVKYVSLGDRRSVGSQRREAFQLALGNSGKDPRGGGSRDAADRLELLPSLSSHVLRCLS